MSEYPNECKCTPHRIARSATECRSALQPADPDLASHKAMVYFHWCKHESAAQEARPALQVNPNFAYAHWVLGRTPRQQGHVKKAEREYRKAGPRPASPRWPTFTAIQAPGPQPYLKALLRTAAGDYGQALTLLEEAYARRDLNIPYTHLGPRFDVLHREPRYRSLIAKLGLPVE